MPLCGVWFVLRVVSAKTIAVLNITILQLTWNLRKFVMIYLGRAHASYYVNTTNADNWHQRDKYKTSIYVEMTRAIVDCKLNLGAFNPA